jgi:2-polyprenyl-3-methyl-5-hydroxy-6-metoxy-1,4-benzoquinol methylase
MVGKNKRVLEVGSGPGSITKLLSSVSNCRVTALDVDAESIRKLETYCERTYHVDLNTSNWQNLLQKEEKFDVLVAADVLEHLYDPLAVLKTMKDFLGNDGYIVISLPHVGHSVISACLLDEDFEYGDSGLLDKTHIRFFGIKNMQKLVEDCDMKILQAEFVIRNPNHTEFSKRWAKTSPEIRAALSKNPFGLVYQVIMKIAPCDTKGDSISLMSMCVTPQKPKIRESIRAFLRLHLSKKMYLLINKIISRISSTVKG